MLGKIDAAGAALDLAVDAFKAVGGTQAGTLAVREFECRKAFGQIVLGPLRELGRIRLPGIKRLTQEPLGLGLVGSVEDRADTQGYRFLLIKTGDIRPGVLLQMELAALPGYAGQGGPTGGLEAGMIVGYDQFYATQAAPDQAIEESAPMDLGLRRVVLHHWRDDSCCRR